MTYYLFSNNSTFQNVLFFLYSDLLTITIFNLLMNIYILTIYCCI